MNCPYCNSPVLLNDVAGNPWYKCGTTKTFRSASCVDREPLATELRNALARIKRLVGELESTKVDRDSWSDQSDEIAKTAADLINRVKRLEEAGDKMASAWDKEWLTEADIEAIIDDWHGAKEAKP